MSFGALRPGPPLNERSSGFANRLCALPSNDRNEQSPRSFDRLLRRGSDPIAAPMRTRSKFVESNPITVGIRIESPIVLTDSGVYGAIVRPIDDRKKPSTCVVRRDRSSMCEITPAVEIATMDQSIMQPLKDAAICEKRRDMLLFSTPSILKLSAATLTSCRPSSSAT